MVSLVYYRLDMADDQHEEVSKVSAEEEIRRGITVMRRVVQEILEILFGVEKSSMLLL